MACAFYDKVTFIDSGVNTDMAACPGGAQVELECVFDVVGQRMEDLATAMWWFRVAAQWPR